MTKIIKKKKEQHSTFGIVNRFIARNFKAPTALTIDTMLSVFSLWAAMYLRTGWQGFQSPLFLSFLLTATPVVVLVSMITFWGLGLHKAVWRYVSIKDITVIAKAIFISIIVSLGVLFVLTRLEGLPRTVPIIQMILAFLFIGGIRVTYRYSRQLFGFQESPQAQRIPVLIYGAGDSAELFIRSTVKTPSIYKVVGIIDDRPKQKGRSIHGVSVIGNSKDLEAINTKLKKRHCAPQKLILAHRRNNQKIKGPVLRTLTERAEKCGMTLAQLPSIDSFQTTQNGLQPVAIEDLLGRPQQVLNADAIQSMLSNKKILITGAGGSIGSEICRQVVAFNPKELILIDNCEHNLYEIDHQLRAQNIICHSYLGDVRDRERINQIMAEHAPHTVFHAAAYKHVPMVEHNPAEGVLTNVIGTRNVADLCHKHNVQAMIQISTDKAVNPTNIMGATKKYAEMYCQSLDLDPKIKTRYMTVRFGNVLGSSGSVVPLFQKQINAGGPITVTDPNITRFFMTIPEAVGLVLSASAYGLKTAQERGKIFVLDMGQPIKISDLAHQMIRLSGLQPNKDIKIIYTGLRPGEKMYEELFNDGEETEKTGLKNIQTATPDVVKTTTLVDGMTKLERAATANKIDQIITIFNSLIPGFKR